MARATAGGQRRRDGDGGVGVGEPEGNIDKHGQVSDFLKKWGRVEVCMRVWMYARIQVCVQGGVCARVNICARARACTRARTHARTH